MGRLMCARTIVLSFAVLMASLSTGCGGMPTRIPPTPTAKPTEAASVTVRWVLPGEVQDGSDAVWAEANRLVAAKLPNTTLEIIPYAFDTYADRTKLMIAAGEDFDIMWASDWLGDYIGKVNGGAFQPIDVLMDQYAPQLETFLPAWMLQAGQLNGRFYGLLNYQQLWRAFGIVTRDSIAAKYGLDMAGFEADSANRNLESIDVLRNDLEPFFAKALADTSKSEIYILNTTGLAETVLYRDLEPIYSVGSIEKFVDRDLKILNTYKTRAYKDLLTLAADWYDKGYIRKDVITAQSNLTIDERKQYVMEIGNSGSPEDFDIELSTAFGEPTSGSRFTPIYVPYNAGAATMNFINAKSKNPDRAIQVLEQANTDVRIYNTLVFGVEGVQYTIQPDVASDVVPMKAIEGSPTYGLYDWVIGSVANSWGRYAEYIDYRFTKWNNQAPKSVLFGFRPVTTTIADQITKCNSVLQEYNYLTSGADKDYLKHYDEFIAALDAAGAEDIIFELQKQVDAFLKE